MRQFIFAVKTGLANQNWYGALASALILPDICAKLEHPKMKSQRRYIGWCNKYLAPRYVANDGKPKPHVFLGGADCYALRCAYLHEGADVITEQRAREALDRFQFVTTSRGNLVHMNQSGSMLQLQVDVFCRDLCDATDVWFRETEQHADVQARMRQLLVIHAV